MRGSMDEKLNALQVINGLHDALTQAIDRIICEDVDMERIAIRLCLARGRV